MKYKKKRKKNEKKNETKISFQPERKYYVHQPMAENDAR